MLAVIWQDLRAEMENSILLFENAEQMAVYISYEHGLKVGEKEQIVKDGYAVLSVNDDGQLYLLRDNNSIIEAPRGSFSYTAVDCNDQREWEQI